MTAVGKEMRLFLWCVTVESQPHATPPKPDEKHFQETARRILFLATWDACKREAVAWCLTHTQEN